jgi:hypothetical protein
MFPPPDQSIEGIAMSTSSVLNFSSVDSEEKQFRVDAPTFFDEKMKEPEVTNVFPVIKEVPATFFAQSIALEQIRFANLRKQRLIFGIASLVCLLSLATCLFLKLPFEPAAAILCCFTGMFVVFAMKVKDAQG